MQELYATIDLGSNSFHMLIAALEHNEIKILESNSDKVMLAEGLSKQQGIHPDAMQRGLECITRFAQRIENIPKENIRIVGTNTLRAAKNAAEYVDQIEAILKVNQVDIVSGIEEARLIYLGVNHTWSGLEQFTRNLVIDIGGGSTEFIIGKNFKLKKAESLRMGCVAYQRFFPDYQINENYFKDAVRAARFELNNILADFPPKAWEYAVGSAGTFRAIEEILIAQGLTDEGITMQGLRAIKEQLLSFQSMFELDIVGLKPTRIKTIVPGIAIGIAIFKSLQIDKLHIAQGGLREGILYDLLGRLKSEDIRQRSISAISRRYNVPEGRSKLLTRICRTLAKKTRNPYHPMSDYYLKLLGWSAECCRIGLAINHSQYHVHSAYLIRNSELSGFSLRDRKILSLIIYNQRRKIDLNAFEQVDLSEEEKNQIYQLIFILRLAIIIGKNGKSNHCDQLKIRIENNQIQLIMQKKWRNRHDLIKHAIGLEKAYWASAGFTMRITLTHPKQPLEIKAGIE